MKFTRTSGKTIAIDSVIHTVRGGKIILDAHLARIYGVTTKRLNEQVKRNVRRFPSDLAFRLSNVELQHLAGQIANQASRATGRKLRPVAKNTAIHVFSPMHSPSTERSWLLMF
jgi:hypothetical protein